MLKVKRLHPEAKLPTVVHPGEDLAYDLYALEDASLRNGIATKVRTGVAVSASLFDIWYKTHKPAGLLIRDRSSMAAQGVTVSGGVIDAGYRGEILVLMTKHGNPYYYLATHEIKAGDKIAQMIPIPVLTGEVIEVDELEETARGQKGFGSSGR